MSKEEAPPKTLCCNAPIGYVDIKPHAGQPGKHAMNRLVMYCSNCQELMDGNGFKLVSSKEKIA